MYNNNDSRANVHTHSIHVVSNAFMCSYVLLYKHYLVECMSEFVSYPIKYSRDNSSCSSIE